MNQTILSALTAVGILAAANDAQAYSRAFYPEDFQRYPICSKEFCQTPDRGASFRYECEMRNGTMSPAVWTVFRSDGGCYCPCTWEYRLYQGQ